MTSTLGGVPSPTPHDYLTPTPTHLASSVAGYVREQERERPTPDPIVLNFPESNSYSARAHVVRIARTILIIHKCVDIDGSLAEVCNQFRSSQTSQGMETRGRPGTRRTHGLRPKEYPFSFSGFDYILFSYSLSLPTWGTSLLASGILQTCIPVSHRNTSVARSRVTRLTVCRYTKVHEYGHDERLLRRLHIKIQLPARYTLGSYSVRIQMEPT